MRETRSSGSVEGVLSNGHPYSDCDGDEVVDGHRAAGGDALS
jgi:hypothetical protein